VFELIDALALPQLVGECDEQILERDVISVPCGMGDAAPRDHRCDAIREQQGLTGHLVCVTRRVLLGGMDDLARIVECGTRKDRRSVEDQSFGRQRVAQRNRGLEHEFVMPHEPGRGADAGEQRECCVGAQNAPRETCASAGTVPSGGFSLKITVPGIAVSTDHWKPSITASESQE
jgi:hypothetical protein